jgi:signal transduction histidine kinase
MNLSAFRLRVLGGALMTAALAVALVWISVSAAVWSSRPTPDGVPDVVAAACQADPAAWDGVDLGPFELRVYDRHGARPGHRPLDIEGWEGLAVGAVATDLSGAQIRVARRVAEDGPCTYVVEAGRGPRGLFDALQVGWSIGAFLSVLAVAGLSYAFTIVPLLRRIERLRGAAVRVGGPEYAVADDRVGDALAEIGATLDRSHDRIEADRAELVARQEALERYLAEIAHDLRTPMGALLLGLQETRAETGSASASRALVDAAYLSALIENLHQAARLRHGLDAREGQVDLREVVTRAEVRFRALGEVQGVQVAAAIPDGPVVVQCTPVLAERAVQNLVQNALQHGARHVAMVLRAKDGAFTLEVRDDGPGVADAADLGLRTFTTSAERPRGPGLGLAITNEIARRAGWSIHYRAEDGLVVEIAGPLVG